MSGNYETEAGESINDHTAMRISTVYACCRVLSQSVASLPCQLLRITPQGRVQEIENPLSYLLEVAPNTDMTSFLFFETFVYHLVLTGNAYAEIQRSDNDGSVIGLWNLNPRKTRAARMPNGDLVFETTDGQSQATPRIIPAKDCIHVPLLSNDGIVGMSPVEHAARSFGIAAAASKMGSRFFGNFAMPKIALTSTGRYKPEVKQQMRKDWEDLQSGKNQHRVAVLDQDMDVKVLSITPDEAQFIQTRTFERSEICAIFQVPTHMCGSEQKLSNSNVEAINLSFITDTLRPLCNRIESELNIKLLPREMGQSSKLVTKFDLSERQRGDTAAQVSLISAGRQWGVLTANCARRMLGLSASPDPAQDVYLTPINMTNSERLLDPPATPTNVVLNE